MDLAFLFHEIWVDRIYSPPGYEVRDGETVVDVGANIGMFSIFAATSAKGVRVYSYEPFTANVHWLRKNINSSLLSNVFVDGQAVAGSRGIRTLRVEPSNWIVHHLAMTDATDHGLPVECVSLDDVLASNAIEICDLLKLDCEGSEYEILRGCRPATLGRVKRIVGEYHEFPGDGNSGQGLCCLMESRGFVVERFKPFEDGGGIFCARNRRLSVGAQWHV